MPLNEDWIVRECRKRARRKTTMWAVIIPIGAFFVVAVSTQSLILGLLSIATYALVLWFLFRPHYHLARDIDLHPVLIRLSKWSDREEAVLQAQREIEEANPHIRRDILSKKAGLTLTDNFLFVQRLLTFDIVPLHHLVWCYRKRTIRMVSFIPFVTNEAIFHFAGGTVYASASAVYIDKLLAHCRERVPWAFFGYEFSLSKAFRSNPETVYRAVISRRREWES